MNWLDWFQTPLSKIAAILLAIGTIGTAATWAEIRPVVTREFYAAQRQLDGNIIKVQEQVEKTADAINTLTFQILVQKRQYGGLTFQEQLELCRVVAELGYSGQEVKALTGC